MENIFLSGHINQKYIDHNGKLYVEIARKGGGGHSLPEKYELVKADETSITAKLIYSSDETQTTVFKCVYQDGKWKVAQN